jgi:dihydrofolate reductase
LAVPRCPFEFVTDGVHHAIERARDLAGSRDIGVTGGDVGGQILAAGLVDEIQLDLVPVVLGRGVPFLGRVRGVMRLRNPRVVAGDRVTHLSYQVSPG